MQITIQDYYHDEPRTTSVARFVESALEEDMGGGTVESIRSELNNTKASVGRLVELLADKELLSVEEVYFIAKGMHLHNHPDLCGC